MYPSFLYHQVKAPLGRVFTDEAAYAAALAAGWVDTPAKFDAKKQPPKTKETEK